MAARARAHRPGGDTRRDRGGERQDDAADRGAAGMATNHDRTPNHAFAAGFRATQKPVLDGQTFNDGYEIEYHAKTYNIIKNHGKLFKTFQTYEIL